MHKQHEVWMSDAVGHTLVATATNAAMFCVVSGACAQAEETVVHQAYNTPQYNQKAACQQVDKETGRIIEGDCVDCGVQPEDE